MKKHNLHQITRIAALSFVNALTVLGVSEAAAQEPVAASKTMPPIVSGDQLQPQTNLLTPVPAKKPELQKSFAAAIDKAASGAKGAVKQVSGTLEPLKKSAIAKAFSPAKIPVRKQGSGSRNAPAPALQFPSPAIGSGSRNVPTPAVQIPSPSFGSGTRSAPSGGSGSRNFGPSAPVVSGSLVGPGTDGQVTVSPNYFDSAAPATDPVPYSNVVSGGVQNNSQPPDPRRVNYDYGTYGAVSAARRYAYLEGLILTREDGDITNSNFNPLGEFDFGGGWRFTIGQRPDRTQGREISYFGTSGIENRQVTNNADNRLDALFAPAGAIIPADLSAFFDASQHIQFKESEVHSLEFNRVRWGWDVLKSFIGFRYLYFDDHYQLDSTSSFDGPIPVAEETGLFRIDAVNHLIGGHIGAELFYDIGYRFSVSGISKYGVYVNINEVDNMLVNDGTVLLDTENNSATISSTYELGVIAHYQLRQTARLRVGYNALFIGSVAATEENFSPFVSPFTGFDSSDDDDVFFHGFSFGLEIYR